VRVLGVDEFWATGTLSILQKLRAGGARDGSEKPAPPILNSKLAGGGLVADSPVALRSLARPQKKFSISF